MTALEDSLLSRIRTLTPEQLGQVDDFVEFLAWRSRRVAALDRLLAIAPALDAAGVRPLSDEEIGAEVRVARTERRAGGQEDPGR